MKNFKLDWRLNIGGYLLAIGFSLFLFSNNTRLKSRIAKLQGEITVLKSQNDSLAKQRVAYYQSLATYEEAINNLETIKDALVDEKHKLEKRIKDLNSKYEKAKTHAANYTTDSIRSYFSNFE